MGDRQTTHKHNALVPGRVLESMIVHILVSNRINIQRDKRYTIFLRLFQEQ